VKFFPRTGTCPLTIRIDGRSLLHNGVTESWRHRVARTEPRDSAGSDSLASSCAAAASGAARSVTDPATNPRREIMWPETIAPFRASRQAGEGPGRRNPRDSLWLPG